jgi:hypothetical protein
MGIAAPRHSTQTVAEARRLHAAGWTVYSIAKLMRRRGSRVSDTTIAGWVNPELADRRRREEAQRARVISARRCRGRLGAGPPRSPEFRFERMRSLRAMGVAYSAIAAVMTFDFPGEPITADQARHALKSGEIPAVYRDALARQAVNGARRSGRTAVAA